VTQSKTIEKLQFMVTNMKDQHKFDQGSIERLKASAIFERKMTRKAELKL